MIQVLINSVDRTDNLVKDSLEVEQVLTNEVDTASFMYRKYGSHPYLPAVGDVVQVYDGSNQIFGGTIIRISEAVVNSADGLAYSVDCVDYTYQLDSQLVSKVYNNTTVQAIIADIISTKAPGFTTNNVSCLFSIGQMVFNQVPITECLKRLAEIVRYDYYVDAAKDLHFFAKETNSAPFNLTDTSGNYIPSSLERRTDGSQIANVVIVRGGEYDANTLTDKITVNGNVTKSFKLPYKFSNLSIKVNTVPKTIGIDNIDQFPTVDVLYNYQDQSFRFNANLADGDVVEFSGNPKTKVRAVALDAASIAAYGRKEKIIDDSSIENLDTARRRAIAEIAVYKDPNNELEFDTYQSGLRSGQIINYTSAKRGINIDYVVYKVVFKPFTSDTYVYHVSLVTNKKIELTQVLQNLLKPKDIQSSESEFLEDIRTDIREIDIAELIQRISPYTDVSTMSISESVSKDPLGANTEPNWVLGPYYPSSVSDTKRVGLLDRSLKLT